MDYKKKYEEALGRASKLRVQNPFDNVSQMMEHIFPELKESEDERIRKTLYGWVSVEPDDTFKEGFTKEQILAWLENLPSKPQSNSALKEEKADNANKIEPKFKVGDWVVFENKHQSTYQVEKIKDGYYILRHTHGGYFRICVLHDESLRLWTIEDAKDGDVLCCESGWTCIFKKLGNNETFSSYCFMDNTKWFCETGSECHTFNEEFVKAYNGKILPATKEQRELLFAKMKEDGYKWDVNNKQLIKL